MSDFYSIIEDLERKTMETLEETRQEYQELLRSFDINPRSTAEQQRPMEPEQDFSLIENQGIDLQDDRYERMFQDLIQYDTGIDSDFWNDNSSSASGSSSWGNMSNNEIEGRTLNLLPAITTNDESSSELPDYETMMSCEIPPQITVHVESSPVTAAAREASRASIYDQHSDSAEGNDTNNSSEMPPLISAQKFPGLTVGAYEEVSTCNYHQQSESESDGHEPGQGEAGPGQQEPPFMELIRSVRADMTNDPLPCSSGLQVRRKKIALRSSQRRCIPHNQGPRCSYSVTPSCKGKAQQVYTDDDDEDSDDDDGFGVNGIIRPLPPVRRRKRIRVKADTQEDDADDEGSDEECSVAAQPPPPAQRQRPKRPRVEAGAAQEDEDTDEEFEGNEAGSPPPPEQRLKRPRVQAETSDGDSDYGMVIECLSYAETSDESDYGMVVVECLSHAETSEEETSTSDKEGINQDLTSDNEPLALSTGAPPPPTPGQYLKRVLRRVQLLRSGRRVDDDARDQYVSPSPCDELEFLARKLRFRCLPIYEAVCLMRMIFEKAKKIQKHWRMRGIDASETALLSVIVPDSTLWSIYCLMRVTGDDDDLLRVVLIELANENVQDNVEQPRAENQDNANNEIIWISSDDDADNNEREPEREVYWVSSGSDEDGDGSPAAIVDDDLNLQ